MTLILGIVCTDGIVLAADTSRTLTTGNLTVQQPIETKLEVSNGCVVVGVAGNVGLGQLIKTAVRDTWQSQQRQLRSAAPGGAMATLRNAIWKPIEGELTVANKAQALLGQQGVQGMIDTLSLVALPVSNQPALFHFTHLAAPTHIDQSTGFAAIGSGATAAGPFLGFIRRLFWRNDVPSVAQGTFAAVWTLEHVIARGIYGVGGVPKVVTLMADAGGCKAVELPDDEMQQHREAVRMAEDRLVGASRTAGALAPGGPPVPPSP